MDVPIWTWAVTVGVIVAMRVYDFILHARKGSRAFTAGGASLD